MSFQFLSPFALPLFFLDPGSGSFQIQLLLAVILVAGVAIRLSGRSLRACLLARRLKQTLRKPNRTKSSMQQSVSVRISASFRDPSGFLFQRDVKLLRQVNQVYRENYDMLMSSGLPIEGSERLLYLMERKS